MKVLDIMAEYLLIIPYPWSILKIEAAGFDIVDFYSRLLRRLLACEDVLDYETDVSILRKNIAELKLLRKHDFKKENWK